MEALLKEARTLAMAGQTYAALARYRRILLSHPDHAEAYREIGQVFEMLFDVPSALDAYEACAQRLEAQGRDAEAAQVRQRAARLGPPPPQDLRALQASVEQAPQDPAAHTRLGLAYVERGRDDEAFSAFREVVRLAPQEASMAYEKIGEIFVRKNKPPESVAVWFRHAADTYLQGGHLEDAVRMYQAALHWVPTDQAMAAALQDLQRQMDPGGGLMQQPTTLKGTGSGRANDRRVLELGDVLRGEYRIVRVLGQGGMGAVYLAEGLTSTRMWAVKEMVPHLDAKADRRRIATQFKQEADLLGSLNHSGLPEVVDHFEERDSHYLVMEFIHGDTLQDLIDREGMLKEQKALHYVRRILDILGYLHDRKPPIIFRDLKPSNIMVTPQDDIKLIDFGIAKVLDPDMRTHTAIRGVVSPGFAAVEQFGMDATDERTDIYALGATAYFMLTRTVPPVSLHRAFNQMVLLPLGQLNPAVTPKVVAAIEKMLEVSSEKRFQTVRDVQVALGFRSTTPVVHMTRPEQDTTTLQDPTRPPLPAVRRLDRDGSELVLVPGGVFWMGSGDADNHTDEQPMHKVKLPDYYIGRSAVTFAQFATFATQARYQSQGNWKQFHTADRSQHPVLNVTLYDALQYARWAGARLPTEAEWEKAARGPRGFVYPWGDHWDGSACNHALLNRQGVDHFLVADQGPIKVGTLSQGASPYGALDMSGNLLEWTASLYRAYPYSSTDGRDSPPPPSNLLGRDAWYVLRGGAWNMEDPEAFRCAARYWSYPGVWSPTRGFRLALSID